MQERWPERCPTPGSLLGVKSPNPRARSSWAHPAPLRSSWREGWGPPGQAGLPGWAAAACRPPRRRLPGAAQRAACCSRSPPALAPGQRPGSAAEQRARAAPSCSSSCCSLLLQRKTEQEPLKGDRQASAPAACPALPCLQRGAERRGRTGREPAAGTLSSGSAAPLGRLLRAGGPAGQPGPALALPSSELWAAAEAPRPRRTSSSGRCPARASPSSSTCRPALGGPACMATLKGQVSTAQAVAGACLSFPNSPAERQSPPPLLDGTLGGPCLGSACKNQAALREQPRSSKGRRRRRRAATRHQQPERARAGTLCPPGLSAPRSTSPPTAASEDVPPFLVAPQPSPLPECHRRTLRTSHTSSPRSPHSPGTPAQPEAGQRQPFSPLPGPPSASPRSWRSTSSTGQERRSARR